MSATERLGALGDIKAGKEKLRKISEELVRLGIEVEDLGRLARIGMYQGLTKDDAGEAHIHDLYGFQLSPSWDKGPKWPLIQPGPPVIAKAPKVSSPKGSVETVVVLPDIQIGYYRHPSGELEATHDERAIDLALQIIRVAKPSKVVMLGDNLDLPEFSRYRQQVAFVQTTQAAINFATTLMGRIRVAAQGSCELHWLAGNHEERLPNYVVDNARAAFALRQGNPTPADWPILSVPHLCRLDDQGVTYWPGYPASDMWIHERLRIIHGDRTRSKGSTAHLYLDAEKSSVIFGHVHRIERAHRTRQDHDGTREIMAASPGCLARTDGAVPSTKQGLDLDGRPLTRPEDWQSGLAVVTLDGNAFDYEQVRIDTNDHFAMWRGKTYESVQ